MKKPINKICLVAAAIGFVMMICGVVLGGTYDKYSIYSGDGEYIESAENISIISSDTRYEMKDIDDIQITMDAGRLYILPGDELRVESHGVNSDFFECAVYDEVLSISSYMPGLFNVMENNNSGYNPEIKVYIPAGFEADDVNIQVDAGKCRIEGLKAEKLGAYISLGALEIMGSEMEYIHTNVSGGKMDIQNVNADEGEFNVDAGKLDVNGLRAKTVKGNVSAGSAKITGDIKKEGYFYCGAGKLDLTLRGSKEEYDWDVNVGMGAISLGGEKFNDNASTSFEGQGKCPEISLDCELGKISVGFE